jgi:hypothetical protein
MELVKKPFKALFSEHNVGPKNYISDGCHVLKVPIILDSTCTTFGFYKRLTVIGDGEILTYIISSDLRLQMSVT